MAQLGFLPSSALATAGYASLVITTCIRQLIDSLDRRTSTTASLTTSAACLANTRSNGFYLEIRKTL